MEHLNESFLAVEEHLIEAIRLLGVNCMGIDPDATRREALDQIAMALANLKTGEQYIHFPDPAYGKDRPRSVPACSAGFSATAGQNQGVFEVDRPHRERAENDPENSTVPENNFDLSDLDTPIPFQLGEAAQ